MTGIRSTELGVRIRVSHKENTREHDDHFCNSYSSLIHPISANLKLFNDRESSTFMWVN